MKKTILILCIGALSFSMNHARAQIAVGVHIGSPISNAVVISTPATIQVVKQTTTTVNTPNGTTQTTTTTTKSCPTNSATVAVGAAIIPASVVIAPHPAVYVAPRPVVVRRTVVVRGCYHH